MTEPEAGSDAASLRTEAVREGDGYRLNGDKIYSTGAATASRIIVVARVASPDSKRSFGLFLVRPDAEGVAIEPLVSTRGDVHASCRIRLNDVRLRPEEVVGGEERLGKAWDVLRRIARVERISVAAMATGLAGSVVKRATRFARERKQFGQPIAAFQAIQHMLVDMHIAHRAMQMFVDRAVEAFASPSSSQDAAMAKCFCAEHLQTIVGQGMRVMGGRAFFEFEEMARYYREAPFTLYAGGTSEVQRMLVARGLGLVT